MRMHLERDTSGNTGALDQLGKPASGEFIAAFSSEHVDCRSFALKLAQEPAFVPPQRMNGCIATLGPPDVELACIQIDVSPFKLAKLAYTQAMYIAD